MKTALFAYMGSDHTGSQTAQLTFPGFFKMQVQVFSNDHVNDGITQELQALIVLVAKTPMGQRQQQPLRRLELVADTSL